MEDMYLTDDSMLCVRRYLGSSWHRWHRRNASRTLDQSRTHLKQRNTPAAWMVISEANSTPFTHKPSHDTGKHTSLHASTEIFQKHNVMKI